MSIKRWMLKPLLIVVAMFIEASFVLSSPLQEWEPWVLEEHQQHGCPWVMAKDQRRACVWPGKLALSAEAKSAAFIYTVDVYEKNAFVTLPGDVNHWPKEVKVNGTPAPIVERNRLPHVVLSSGRHTLSGLFKWQKRPGQLSIPKEVAIVSLQVDGKSRDVDRRNSRLIFSSKSNAPQKKTDDSLNIEVFRLLKDGVPVTLETEIILSVSGKAREVSFGSVMFPGSELLHLRSPIPARIDADNTMRAQLVPGEHRINIVSRFVESPSTIATKKSTKEWPEFEYISFKADTAIRQAKLSGPISIDTTQIEIPSQWQEYPTYQMRNGVVLTLETEFRGDHSPGANTLNVQRDLWLDFDGSGITALDRITGEMRKGWRLNAAKDTGIGRASVDGAPVLITHDEEQQGIEVRSPNIKLEAVTRTEMTSGFSASGWNARADRYGATLHLPPGWRVFHASGVDRVSGTWLSKWNLWDVFLVLIIVSASRKLMGNAVAALAGVTFIIALHDASAALLIIPFLLVVVALLPVVSGKFKSLLRSIGVMLAAVLVLSVISFAVSAFRLAIYPSLERAQLGTYSQNNYGASLSKVASAPAMQMDDRARKLRSKEARLEEVIVTAQKAEQDLYQVTENDRVQTGPGLPTWTWRSVRLNSTGPVPASQALSIYYSAPFITSVWRVMSALLVGLFAAIVIIRFARLSQFKVTDTANKPATSTALGLGLILLAGIANSPDSLAEDYPPKYLLDELEQRLTKAPECLPDCVSLNNGEVSVDGSDIVIRFSVYADADVALPLPAGHNSWVLLSVSDKTHVLPLRKQRNKFFVRIAKGHQDLVLKGKIAGDQATINFPLPIHNISVSASNWLVEGLVNGRVRNNTLTLSASDKRTTQKADTLKADPAPAFVQVQRHFVFGKKWQLETRVQRLAPKQGAISISVALLPNEKPLKDMGVINNGQVVVQLGRSQREVSWLSSIEPTAQFQLNASKSSSYIEEWSFTPSSLWRLNYQGIPSVKSDIHANAFEPVFKPWPGEVLTVNARKPKGVPGDIHTVESALLEVDAGSKLQRSTLTLNIRSSLGTNYALSLPENTEVLKYSIDGLVMNTPTNNNITVPLQPGSQSVEIEFQSQVDIGMISRSPSVKLQDGATNVRIQYRLPADRWPLYFSGPAIGPAMLYWGVLCVIILGALILPRVASATGLQMPISITGWILLGLGLSTVNGYGVLVIAIMFFILAARKQYVVPETMTQFKFNIMQLALVVWVVFAAFTMLAAIPMGLLSSPEMKVLGNGSSSHFYSYYQDIAGVENFPAVTVISVPMLAYRAVMLLWSLWLSMRLIQWASWAWACYTEKETWKSKPPAPAVTKEKE